MLDVVIPGEQKTKEEMEERRKRVTMYRAWFLAMREEDEVVEE